MGAEQVRVGLLVPQYGASARDALDGARAAEAAGLDVWVAGQLLPISATPDKSTLEPLTLMGAIAAVTETARLGFMVLAAPYLPPFYYAKALATLNEIAAGRLEVGLGAGWREEEFAALGIERAPVSERLRAVESVLDALDALAGSVPPVWIAGSGPTVLGVAARRAAWTNVARGISVEDFRAKRALVEQAAERAGRADPPTPSLTATFLSADAPQLEQTIAERAAAKGVSPDEYERRLRAANVFVGQPEQLAEQMGAYAAEGCRAFVLWPLDGDHVTAARQLGLTRPLLEDR